ncbi:hypothetical protein JXB28_06725 [Candidatus Woesearchaeota archaeon]|nr:hypothetical protein [Candidatus Woesearchaeota archaeon]
MKKEKCFECGGTMKIVNTSYKGVPMEAYRCTRCRETILTEAQVSKFGNAFQQKKLKEKYIKRPIKIGHSYAVTFPRDIVSVFGLSSDKTKLDMRADVDNNKIEITVL